MVLLLIVRLLFFFSSLLLTRLFVSVSPFCFLSRAELFFVLLFVCHRQSGITGSPRLVVFSAEIFTVYKFASFLPSTPLLNSLVLFLCFHSLSCSLSLSLHQLYMMGSQTFRLSSHIFIIGPAFFSLPHFILIRFEPSTASPQSSFTRLVLLVFL